MSTISEKKSETAPNENHIWTDDEHMSHIDEMLAAFKRGDTMEGIRIGQIMPFNPIMAMAIKNVYGKEYLLDMGLNLTRANEKWGEGWLDEPYKG